MKAEIEWQQRVQFKATSGTGHTISLDGPETLGGVGAGCRPMELLLMGVGGCTAFDVVTILEKQRQKLTGLKVLVEGDRADAVPAVFTHIRIHFVLNGEGLSEKQVARAVELSATKYCSASIMLGKAAEISHTFEIV